jgi:isopentenyldiphosphate isomerase
VHVLIFNPQGEVFLQQRSLAKDLAPGLWDSSCSGHVDAGEDYDHSARRELGEELGLDLPGPPPRWFHTEARAETGWEFVWVYRLEHAGPFALNPAEISDGRWVLPGDLDVQIRNNPKVFSLAFRWIWALAPVR